LERARWVVVFGRAVVRDTVYKPLIGTDANRDICVYGTDYTQPAGEILGITVVLYFAGHSFDISCPRIRHCNCVGVLRCSIPKKKKKSSCISLVVNFLVSARLALQKVEELRFKGSLGLEVDLAGDVELCLSQQDPPGG
jgi:hypothetical protein